MPTSHATLPQHPLPSPSRPPSPESPKLHSGVHRGMSVTLFLCASVLPPQVPSPEADPQGLAGGARREGAEENAV